MLMIIAAATPFVNSGRSLKRGQRCLGAWASGPLDGLRTPLRRRLVAQNEAGRRFALPVGSSAPGATISQCARQPCATGMLLFRYYRDGGSVMLERMRHA